MRIFLSILSIVCLCCSTLFAQEKLDTQNRVPATYFTSVDKQATKVDSKISKENRKALRKWARQEKRILRMIVDSDSIVGQSLQKELDTRNQQFANTISNPSEIPAEYFPALDTLKSSINYLIEK